MARPGYQVIRYPDAGAFLERAEAWLMQREAKYNLLLGVARNLACSVKETESPAFMATVEKGEMLHGCVFRTPPDKLSLTEMPTDAVVDVAREVGNVYEELPAVLGPEPVAGTFAREWARVRPVRWQPGMKQRIYKLERLSEETRHVSGAMEFATIDDAPLVTGWLERFSEETGLPTRYAREMAELLIDHDALVLWDDGGRRSMAGTQGYTERGVRISYVYTPVEHRGRGYASALVRALSRTMLERGRAFCVLYADLSNPISNSIYTEMGYIPVEDVRDYTFVPST